jgi:signal transduction histidine kinase
VNRPGATQRRWPRPRGQGTSLRVQLALLPFLVGLAALLVITLGYYLVSRDDSLDQVAAELGDIGRRTATNLEQLIIARVRVVETLARHPGLRHAIAEDPAGVAGLDPAARRQRLAALDARWRQAGAADPFVTAYLTGPAAALLRRHATAVPADYGELFVTDRFGALVGATGRLTTFAHGHKYWWRAAHAGGDGRVFLDDRGFDDSVGDIVLGVVVPVRDDDGTLVGILKANIRLRELLDAMVAPRADSLRTQLAVVRSGGAVLREAGAEPLTTSLAHHDTGPMQAREPFTDISAGPTHALVTAFAPIGLTLGAGTIGFGGSPASEDHRGGNGGEYWGVLAERNVGAAAILGVSPLLFASAAGGALLLIGLLSGVAADRLARPIREVAAALERFESDAVVPDLGERGPREARVLRAAFRTMARRLSEQTTSIERLRAEVARRQAAEMRANLALAELQQAFEKSLQVEKLSALGTFVGGIAHEVKNPLMGLSNYIDHVRAELDDPELRGILDRALHQVQRIEHIVDGVLRYAGGERAERGPLDLADIVGDVTALLKSQIERGGVELTVSIPEPLPGAFGDRGVIEQALVNLVLNAAHAVRDRPRREVHIELSAEPGGGAAIAVSDSGPGVAPRLRQRIWEPFFTTKAPGEGTGLGLSVAAQNLTASGAALILDSGFGGGARFVIRLPGAPEDVPEAPAATA